MNRVYYNLTENPSYTITFENIFYRYVEHCGANNIKTKSKNDLGRLIGTAFPNCKKLNTSYKHCYRGLGWRTSSNLVYSVAKNIIPQELIYHIQLLCTETDVLVNNQTSTVHINTKQTSNGAPLYKEICFKEDHWELKCRGVPMDLTCIGITPNYFLPANEQAEVILRIVNNIRYEIIRFTRR